MIKEIKYNGYSANPSDYECADGDLATTMGLIQEDGTMKPLLPPVEVCCLNPGERVICIHKTSAFSHYIILSDDCLSLSWIDSRQMSSRHLLVNYESQVRDVTPMGNILIVSLNSGLAYVLWKHDAYNMLGEKPPSISIDFAMRKVDTLRGVETFNVPATCDPTWTRGCSTEDIAEFAQTVYGFLLPQIADSVTSKGYFYQPFFVRYAYRMFDGSHMFHSAPILMLPTILPPFIRYKGPESGSEAVDGYVEATLSACVPYFSLEYRILSDDIENLSDWSDIISGVDVFISAPIYTYDQSRALPYRPVGYTYDLLSEVCNDFSSDSNATGGRPSTSVSTLAENVFIGHYADDWVEGTPFIDHTMKTTRNDDNPDYYQCVMIPPHPDFHNNIRSEHLFYKIAHFDTQEIKGMAGMAGMQYLPLIDRNLSALVTFPKLSDDYQSRCSLLPASSFVYNSRLNCAGVKIIPAAPFPLRSLMQYGNPSNTASRARITVWMRKNGQRVCITHYPGNSSDADSWCDPEKNFPRYIFYPDAAAYKMEIFISDDKKWIIDLKPHDFLNGAYWYRGKEAMSINSLPQESADPETGTSDPETGTCDSHILALNKIYTSEVNNPFYFPVLGINTVGTGNILGICAAAKALSEGQFGQFPLYAFTTDGVWALEVSDTGTYSAKQPVSRDVIINTDSITQMDRAVLFATDRGIMHISGSTVQCISDRLNTEDLFSIADLPKCDKLINIFNGRADESEQVTLDDITLLPFNEFLQDCRMVYDYTNQHIIVYNPAVRYAYVYSLKSQTWGMMQSDIIDNVNSWPESLAMADGAKLVNLSKSMAENITALVVTRPFKIDDPNMFKTINTIIQRGMFRSTHVQQVLYGSNDLIHWHTIWSSVDKIMRGFRGTPYKAFRLALVCKFDRDESIYGFTVVYEPRMTNQVR